jgi:glycosyltransferase involved in cell wall biosynthesis
VVEAAPSPGTQVPARHDLAVVGTVGLPAGYGGFETLAEQLTLRLAARHRFLVFCSRKGRAACPPTHLGAELAYVDLDANGWQSIFYDFVGLWRAARTARTILVLGVSGCLLLPLVRWWRPSARIVTNIDGVEWKRQKWGLLARAVLRWSERSAVRFSHAVIADNEGIRQHVRERYGREASLIAYGGDTAVPASTPARPAGTRDTRFAAAGYFLAICRIEPENHIAEMLEAFAGAPHQRLVIVGNWQASRYGSGLRAAYGGHTNIQLLDPIYDAQRLQVLRREALACVHGHSAGGTNPSLVEAMSMGMAVLAFDVSYNRFTTHQQAAYWSDPASLGRLVAASTPAQLAANAKAMGELAQSHYTWAKIASQYEALLFAEVKEKPHADPTERHPVERGPAGLVRDGAALPPLDDGQLPAVRGGRGTAARDRAASRLPQVE